MVGLPQIPAHLRADESDALALPRGWLARKNETVLVASVYPITPLLLGAALGQVRSTLIRTHTGYPNSTKLARQCDGRERLSGCAATHGQCHGR